MTEPKEMTPEEKRIRIATACGWEIRASGQYKNQATHQLFHNGKLIQTRYIDVELSSLPDYLNSLDAMHEAEKALDWDQQVKFRIYLMMNSDGRKATYRTAEAALCHATVAQRAEALLAVICAKPTPSPSGGG